MARTRFTLYVGKGVPADFCGYFPSLEEAKIHAITRIEFDAFEIHDIDKWLVYHGTRTRMDEVKWVHEEVKHHMNNTLAFLIAIILLAIAFAGFIHKLLGGA